MIVVRALLTPGHAGNTSSFCMVCREKIWDHVAGVVVFQEAGGVVTDGTGAPLDFGLGRYLDGMQKGLVASTPSAHARVVEAVASSPAE